MSIKNVKRQFGIGVMNAPNDNSSSVDISGASGGSYETSHSAEYQVQAILVYFDSATSKTLTVTVEDGTTSYKVKEYTSNTDQYFWITELNGVIFPSSYEIKVNCPTQILAATMYVSIITVDQ